MKRLGEVDSQAVIDSLVDCWAEECAGNRGDICESCRTYEAAITTVAATATGQRGLTVEQVREHMGERARLISTMCAGDRVILTSWQSSDPNLVTVAWENPPSAMLHKMVVTDRCEHRVSRFDLALA